MRHILVLMLTIAALTQANAPQAADLSVPARIEQAMFGEHRSEAHQARNRYRHPVGTLTFFGLDDGMTVLEIWPGGLWYTEILAPVMRDAGRYIVAGYDVEVEGQPDYRYRQQAAMEERFAAQPELFDQVEIQPYSPPQSGSLGEAGSIDLIVTFRNAHGWVGGGIAYSVFDEFERVLKPGGRVGIVQHRAANGSDAEATAGRGYVSEAAIIEMAERAGLTRVARSEVNANPKDTKDYPDGVWTLPPSLRLGQKDRDRYLAIGESDRMTLLFEKPGF